MTAFDALLIALATVESGNDPAKMGDNGTAIGPLQIRQGCWIDACREQPSLNFYLGEPAEHKTCKDPTYARRVAYAYLMRYCPRSVRTLEGISADNTTFELRRAQEVCARTWNGGPKGAKHKSTLAYWGKVQTELRKMEAKK